MANYLSVTSEMIRFFCHDKYILYVCLVCVGAFVTKAGYLLVNLATSAGAGGRGRRRELAGGRGWIPVASESENLTWESEGMSAHARLPLRGCGES